MVSPLLVTMVWALLRCTPGAPSVKSHEGPGVCLTRTQTDPQVPAAPALRSDSAATFEHRMEFNRIVCANIEMM